MLTKLQEVAIYHKGVSVPNSKKCTVLWDVRLSKQEIEYAKINLEINEIFGYYEIDGAYSAFEIKDFEDWKINIIYFDVNNIVCPKGIIINFDEKSVQLKF